MLTVLHWFTIALLIAGSLALLAIVSPERRFWKVATLGLTAMFLPISYLAANDLLSRPKPMQHELLTQRLNEATVVASLIRDQQDIYIWLAMKGLSEPRAYRLPWDEALAVKLHKTQSQAEAQGTDMVMTINQDDTATQSVPDFSIRKPPPAPPKNIE